MCYVFRFVSLFVCVCVFVFVFLFVSLSLSVSVCVWERLVYGGRKLLVYEALNECTGPDVRRGYFTLS